MLRNVDWQFITDVYVQSSDRIFEGQAVQESNGQVVPKRRYVTTNLRCVTPQKSKDIYGGGSLKSGAVKLLVCIKLLPIRVSVRAPAILTGTFRDVGGSFGLLARFWCGDDLAVANTAHTTPCFLYQLQKCPYCHEAMYVLVREEMFLKFLSKATAHRLQLRCSYGKLRRWKSIHKRGQHGMGIRLVSEYDSATIICGKTSITDITVLRYLQTF
jgi:hypothetical protein